MAKKKETAGPADREIDEEKQPLLAHLLAMRNMILYSAIAVLIGFVVCMYFAADPLLAFITQPITGRGVQVIYTTVSEALVTKLKVSLLAGVVVASPYVMYQIWAFVKPALYENEISAFRPLFFIALFLFVLGIFFSYYCVYGLAIDFFLVAGEDLAVPMLSIDRYVSFLVGFLLPFGVVCEMPVVIYMAAKKGLVGYRTLAKNRKYVLFGIFVLAAILTPPDVVSQVMLGLPMYVLYEVSVQISRFVGRKSEEDAEA